MLRIFTPVRRLQGIFLMVASSTLAAGFGAPSHAQVKPAQACALINQPIRVAVTDEAGVASKEPSPLRIDLVSPERGEIVQSEVIDASQAEIDLARVFPRLWETPAQAVLYAQLARGETAIGPALILEPMAAPRYAPRADRDGVPQFTPGAVPSSQPASAPSSRDSVRGPKSNNRTFSGYWLSVDKHAVVETSRGTLVFRLRPDVAPNSVRNFRELVEKGFYSNIPVHRIASLLAQPQPDIIQFGDPTGTGQGGPGYMIDLEPSTLRHDYGVLSYARTSDPNSAGSQVIICLSREGTSSLDGKYASFAQLIAGAETIRALAKTPVNADGKPLEAPIIKSITLVDASPFPQTPEPLADPMKQVPAR